MDVEQTGGQYGDLPETVPHPAHGQEAGWQAGVDVEQPGGH